MGKTPARRHPLILQVLTALGGLEVHESHIEGAPNEQIHGLQEGNRIWVNPTYSTVATLLHETIHALYPRWSEEYVQGRETFLMNRLSEQEIQHLYTVYRAKTKTGRTKKA